MNNPIEIALVKIHSNIPEEILSYAFQKRNNHEEVYPLDEMILTKVIRYRVIKDMNIDGGKFKEILLRREYLEVMDRDFDDFYMHTGKWSLYRIPADVREDLPIAEVMNLKFRGVYAGYLPNTNGWTGGANINTLANGVLDAHTFASSPPRPNVELLSGDLVRLWPSQHSNIMWAMNVRLCYDENVTNLNTSAIEPFAMLCLYAVQAYIYNTLVITVDKAFIQGGYQIGVFKSILDSYADANQKYEEQLTQVAGATFLDPGRLNSFLQYIL